MTMSKLYSPIIIQQGIENIFLNVAMIYIASLILFAGVTEYPSTSL